MENMPTEKEISRLLDEGKVVVIGRERGCVVMKTYKSVLS